MNLEKVTKEAASETFPVVERSGNAYWIDNKDGTIIYCGKQYAQEYCDKTGTSMPK